MRVVHRLRYDTERFPFAEVAAEVLGVTSLAVMADEVLAEKRRRDPNAILATEDNLRLRGILAATPPDHPLRRMYVEATMAALSQLATGSVALTTNPTFRVHLPGTPTVSGWHRDADVTRRLDYINLWVPFVDAEGTATIWVDDNYGSHRPEPIAVNYGEMLVFDGGLLRHGSVTNTTSITRVSFDARFAVRTDEWRSAVAPILAGRRPEDLVLAEEGSIGAEVNYD